MLEGKLDLTELDQLVDWYGAYQAVLPFGHGMFAEVRGKDSLAEVWFGTIVHLLSDSLGAVREPYQAAADAFRWKQ
jgi:hypothetical protein